MAERITDLSHIQSISAKIRETIKNINEIKVISASIFGSVARHEENADSDIDLLIVAEGIGENRIQRIPYIVKIKKNLKIEAPIDILLVSKDECQANFRNHNPFYLDIAFDAEIILDDNGFLSDLMKETKEYVKSNDIKRGIGSWLFPVEYRKATFLSKITNKDWAVAWLTDAKRDLLAASHLLGADLFEKTIYHCQQAVEKGIKAILAALGEFQKTHFVSDVLRKLCEERDLGEWKEKLTEIADIGVTTEPLVSLSRYPELSNNVLWLPYKEYSIDDAREHLEKAEIVIKTSEGFIEWWFKY